MKLNVGKTLALVVFLGMFFFMSLSSIKAAVPWWEFQAIDTMKQSRDRSREFLGKTQELDLMAHRQVAEIAATGATHVAIATPYDEEFIPILKIWVAAARTHNLKVWFRGNWSGWEGWFNYPRISREEHLEKSVIFVKEHPELFEDGDYFTACPECENGGPGDPRRTGDVTGHRQFLIDEHTALVEAFREIGKDVNTGLNSMNGDVARLIMDKPTTKALGEIVAVDHYVRTPEQLNRDVSEFARLSGGKVILGEWGAPIPDIHGSMSESQQAAWIKKALQLLQNNTDLIGLSYWTHIGGSTAIWNDAGQPRTAVKELGGFYKPQVISGIIKNSLDEPITTAHIVSTKHKAETSDMGHFLIPYIDPAEAVTISAPGYPSKTLTMQDLANQPTVVFNPERPSLWYRFKVWYRAFRQNSSLF